MCCGERFDLREVKLARSWLVRRCDVGGWPWLAGREERRGDGKEQHYQMILKQ